MPRLALALLGALAAGVLSWLALPWLQARLGNPPAPLEILENEEERRDEFAERIAAIEARSPSIPIQAFPDTTLRRARLAREVLGTLRGHFKTKCLDPIRLNTRLAEAPSHRKTIFEYAPKSSGAEDYNRIVDWLVGERQAAAHPAQQSAVA